MTRILAGDLERALNPEMLRVHLGEPLFSYMSVMQPDGLPAIPIRKGSALCLIEHQGKLREWLGCAWILPVKWEKGSGDSQGLPPAIREQADAVRRVTGYFDYRLTFPEELADYDLSDLRFEMKSVQTSLAAALEMAATGGRPDARIFSTGMLDTDYIASVGGIESKVRLLEHLGRNGRMMTLFVPRENLHEAEKTVRNRNRLRIIPYKGLTGSWRTIMADHLRALRTPPFEGSLQERVDYLNIDYVQIDGTVWRKFYLDNVMKDFAVQIRKEAIQRQPRPRRMVGALSYHYEMTLLALHVFKPEEACLITSPEIETDRQIRAEILEKKPHDVKVQIVSMGIDDAASRIRELAAWLRERPQANTRVEATAGTKWMTLVCAAISRVAGAPLVYFVHENPAGVPVISTGSSFVNVPQFGHDQVRS